MMNLMNPGIDFYTGAARYTPALLLLGVLSLVCIPTTSAQTSGNTFPKQLQGIGIDQRLNAQVPLDLMFRNENGETAPLQRYIGAAPDQPTILALVYYECPMLCGLVLDGLLRTLRALTFDVGNQFNIVTVSFDPRETSAMAAAKKEHYLEQYGRDGAAQGWHFLTGDAPAIQQLTQAVGFRYTHDREIDQYIHASGIVVLTPQGKIARYFYGIEYPVRDVRLGLVEAAANRIGSFVDQVLLFCYHYDPATGQYNLLIMNVLRALGTATAGTLATFMIVMFRRDRRRKQHLQPQGALERPASV